jgi:hypothetical protein
MLLSKKHVAGIIVLICVLYQILGTEETVLVRGDIHVGRPSLKERRNE